MAAANVIRELLVRLGVDADTRSLKEFSSGLADIAAGFAKVAAVAAGTVAAISAVTVSFAQQGDTVAKTAKQLGIAGEALQELLFAADRSGVSSSDLRVGLSALVRNAEAFSRGAGEAKVAFEKLKLSARSVTTGDGSLLSVVDLLALVSDGFGELAETDRLAVATRVFGESGGKLVPLLQEGAIGIEELRRQARDLGFVIDSDTLVASERFADSLTNLKAGIKGLQTAVGEELVVSLKDSVDSLTEFVKGIRPAVKGITDFINSTIGLDNLVIGLSAVAVAAGSIAAALAGVATLIGTVFALAGLITSIATIVPVVASIGTAIASFVTFVAGLISSLAAIGALGGVLGIIAAALAVSLVGLTAVAAAAATAVTALISGLALLGLAIEDLVTFISGGESAFEQLLSKLGLTEDGIQQAREAFRALGPLLLAVTDAGLALAGLLGRQLFLAIRLAANTIADFVSVSLDMFAFFLRLFGVDVGGFFKDTASGIEGITAAFEFLADIIRSVSAAFDAFAAAIGGGGLLSIGFDALGAVVTQVTGMVDSLVASLSAAGDIAASVSSSIGSVGGLLGGAVSNVNQSLSLAVNAPITTTASAGETADAVGSLAPDMSALFDSFFGSEQ